MNVRNKIVILLGRTFRPNNLRVRPVAYFGVEHLSGSPLGKAPDLVKNIGLGWKSLQGQTL